MPVFNLRDILIKALVLMLSLSVHECAHGYAAYKLGDDTAAAQGRLTLNPLAHLDPVGSLVFLMAGIGWARPVPINPTRFNRKYSMRTGIVLTSVAGPLSNLILAAIGCFFYYAISVVVLKAHLFNNAILDTLLTIFYAFYVYNISLAVFNLMPVPPLDGYKVFGAVLPKDLYYRIMRYERYIGLLFLMLVFFRAEIIMRLFTAIRIPFDYIIQKPIAWLFKMIFKLPTG